MVNLILIASIVGFIGFSVLPLIGSVLEQPKPTTATSPTSARSPGASPKKEELELQAKGYEAVLQREPDNQTALRGLLETRLALKDVKGAIVPLEKLAKLNPAETNYTVLLAQAKQEVGDLEGSAQVYRDILQKQKGNINALDGLVGLLLRQKRPEAAIDLLQSTLKTAPQENQAQPGTIDVASVQLLLGRVYADQKRLPEAIAVYDEAAKVNKEDFRPVLAKAMILQSQGKPEEAKPLFATAENLAPAQFKDQIKQIAAGASPAPTNAPIVPTPGTTPAPGASPAPSPTPTVPAPSASPVPTAPTTAPSPQ
jgi:tetratricopeptide (TPR) repeat protein